MAIIEITTAAVLSILSSNAGGNSSTKISKLCGYSKNNTKVTATLDDLVRSKQAKKFIEKGVTLYEFVGASTTATAATSQASPATEAPSVVAPSAVTPLNTVEIPTNLPAGYAIDSGDNGVYIVSFPDGKKSILNPGERAIVIKVGDKIEKFKFVEAEMLLDLVLQKAEEFKQFLVKDVILSDYVPNPADLTKNIRLLNIIEISRLNKANEI